MFSRPRVQCRMSATSYSGMFDTWSSSGVRLTAEVAVASDGLRALPGPQHWHVCPDDVTQSQIILSRQNGAVQSHSDIPHAPVRIAHQLAWSGVRARRRACDHTCRIERSSAGDEHEVTSQAVARCEHHRSADCTVTEMTHEDGMKAGSCPGSGDWSGSTSRSGG